jgi:hypothetical protein
VPGTSRLSLCRVNAALHLPRRCAQVSRWAAPLGRAQVRQPRPSPSLHGAGGDQVRAPRCAGLGAAAPLGTRQRAPLLQLAASGAERSGFATWGSSWRSALLGSKSSARARVSPPRGTEGADRPPEEAGEGRVPGRPRAHWRHRAPRALGTMRPAAPPRGPGAALSAR